MTGFLRPSHKFFLMWKIGTSIWNSMGNVEIKCMLRIPACKKNHLKIIRNNLWFRRYVYLFFNFQTGPKILAIFGGIFRNRYVILQNLRSKKSAPTYNTRPTVIVSKKQTRSKSRIRQSSRWQWSSSSSLEKQELSLVDTLSNWWVYILTYLHLCGMLGFHFSRLLKN